MPKFMYWMVLKSLASIACLLLQTAAYSAEIDIRNTPDWVSPLQVPEHIEFPAADIRDGIYYVFLDVQVDVPQDRPVRVYQHYAEHIVNQNGVADNSQINLRYDPSYQTLQLHSLNIHRNGKVIDKITSAAMKILQQEDEMDNLIYNGDYTLNIILDDVRVGDTLEYSFSRIGSNPVYQGIFAYQHNLNWNVPVGEMQLKILWGKQQPLFHSQLNANLPVELRATEYGSEYRVHAKNIQPLTSAGNTPDWYDPWGKIQFTELDSWRQVSQWGLSLYKDAWKTSDQLDAIAEDIRASSDSDEERISKALRFVQSEIRYLGIELGQNSHIPSPASETLQRRYGDCKDKTVLLISLLRKLGIEAHPALVNTELSHTLEQYPPSTRHFNHVITYVEFANKTWWLDPTRTYQYGRISRIHQPDYGMALVLKPGNQSLTKMNPDNRHYGLDVADHFILKDNVADPIQYTTTTTYQGWNAENMRDSLARQGTSQLQEQYLEYFQYYYPEIVVRQDLLVNDNETKNRLVVEEQYEIADFWEDNQAKRRHTTTFYANSVSSYVELPDEPRRSDPLYLTHPQRIHQTITVELADENWFFEDETFIEDNPFFKFQYQVAFNKAKRTLKLNYQYQSHSGHVPADQYPNYLAALEKVQDYLSYSIYQPYAGVTPHWTDQLTADKIIAGLVAGYLLVLLMWRIDVWRKPETAAATFFPVTLPKFLFLWIFSLGAYPIYWFYRNYYYIKQKQDKPIMPVARGIFFWAWYFNLWQALDSDSKARHGESHLPPKILAILMAIVFLISTFAMRDTMFWIVGLALSAALCLPLANYILHINRDSQAAIRQGSRWGIRHALLFLLSTPILLLGAGQELGALPNIAVIDGDRLWQRDLKQLQRNGITRPSDNILYFYSDGFLSIMEDGNGITDRHVFSYWQEDNGDLSSMTATFNQIENIEVTQGKSTWENTIVNVNLKNGNEFVLYLSREDRGDKRFIAALQERIELAKQASDH